MSSDADSLSSIISEESEDKTSENDNKSFPWTSGCIDIAISNAILEYTVEELGKSVQATSTEAERAIYNLNLTLDKKREAMKADLFDLLMFLGDVSVYFS